MWLAALSMTLLLRKIAYVICDIPQEHRAEAEEALASAEKAVDLEDHDQIRQLIADLKERLNTKP
jgi:hypothetical protein